MESYLMITQINDFIFCPRSIYYSGIFRNSVSTDIYHHTPQMIGCAAHETVDNNTYSSRKDIITGLTVFSSRYNLLGRIDILDLSAKLLTERKYSITAIYDGFKYQLYAQFFALQEMGYQVTQMRLHSQKDNRNYEIALPDAAETIKFETILDKMRSFDLQQPFTPNQNKCKHCIYNPLCDLFNEDE